MMEYLDYVRSSQDSLRVLAELTGGIAVVNQNDFTKALKRIDQETSDYYVVGYYSSNPDPTKKRRTHRGQGDAAGRERLEPDVVHAENAAQAGRLASRRFYGVPPNLPDIIGRLSRPSSARGSVLPTSSDPVNLVRPWSSQ